MEPSERVTWEDCPNCRRPAAVGWLGRRPVGCDCPGGCHLSAVELAVFAARHSGPPVDRLTRS
ncbi:hypothetical protein ACI8AF_19060 [Blastococcus sp. SYSU D00669]